jgi:hypothetical protein
VIVIGFVVNTEKLGDGTIDDQGVPIRAMKMKGTLHVEEYVKNDLHVPLLAFFFDLPYEGSGYAGLGPKNQGLFSFVKAPDGGLRLLDPYHPFLVASAAVWPANSDVYDRVISTIEQAALEPGRSEGDRLEALHELTSVKKASLLNSLQSLLADPSERVRIRAAALLVSAGNAEAFHIVEPDLAKRKAAVDEFATRAIALAIANFLKNQEALPDVVDLLKNGNPELRAASALALRSIGSREGIPALLNSLDDSDHEVRFNSTLALTALTEQYQLGALEEEFNRNEGRITQRWKKWGVENGYYPGTAHR